jgi:hypothetical protein
VPLSIVHGPPNSGRAGIVRERFSAALTRDPVLALPTYDDVFAFQRELSAGGAKLGGDVVTFTGLFEQAARRTGAASAGRSSAAQRLRLAALAAQGARPRILARSAAHPGFAPALEKLIEELRAGMLDPAAVEAGAGELEESAYLGELAAIYRAHARLRAGAGLLDEHDTAAAAVAALLRDPGAWGGSPVFLYGFDDLTREQLQLVAALAGATEVTIALTYEERPALAARAGLLERLRELGPASEEKTNADASNTESPLLYAIERGFLAEDAAPAEPDGSLVLLRSAGERGEAEAIGAEIATLLTGGEDPGRIAVALRSPEAHGPLYRSVLGSFGIPVALEADLPLAGTATGGALLPLLRAVFTTRSSADLLAYLRGPRRGRPSDVDWLERTVLRRRLRGAAEAAEEWRELGGADLRELGALRDAADHGRLLAEVAATARDIAEWPLAREGERGRIPGEAESLELRAGAAIATACEELEALAGPAPEPGELIEILRELRMPAWNGPAEGRVRIASPYRLRAGRFAHVFVASLQDGEFPRRDGGSPFLSDEQRAQLGLPKRAETEEEERYLFYVCLSLPTRGLWLSSRVSDESGGAEQPSPLLADVRRLLAPPPPEDPGEADPLTEGLQRGRGLGEIVFQPALAPSEAELARALAVRGAGADHGAALAALGAGDEVSERLGAALTRAAVREQRTRAPGPLTEPAVIAELSARRQYGGTTLENFAVCSYRWFADHELAPEPLGPQPEGLTQGGLMHRALERLYRERPGGDPLPRPASLDAWLARGEELVAEEAARDGAPGDGPAEVAMRRRVETLLATFLRREAAREDPAVLPDAGLLEGAFGEDEDADRPALDLGGWLLHGRIDRVDRSGATGLVQDYKMSSKVTAAAAFEKEGKLQLPLYLIALRELWGIEPLGGLYQPLRASREHRPRGLVRAEAAEGPLADLALYDNDVLDAEEFERQLVRAAERAGEIVARMRRGDITRDPLRDRCPDYCGFAPICRRERGALREPEEEAIEDAR